MIYRARSALRTDLIWRVRATRPESCDGIRSGACSDLKLTHADSRAKRAGRGGVYLSHQTYPSRSNGHGEKSNDRVRVVVRQQNKNNIAMGIQKA